MEESDPGVAQPLRTLRRVSNMSQLHLNFKQALESRDHACSRGVSRDHGLCTSSDHDAALAAEFDQLMDEDGEGEGALDSQRGKTQSKVGDFPSTEGLKRAIAATKNLAALVQTLTLSPEGAGDESGYEGDDETPCTKEMESVIAATEVFEALVRGVDLLGKDTSDEAGYEGDDEREETRSVQSVPSLPILRSKKSRGQLNSPEAIAPEMNAALTSKAATQLKQTTSSQPAIPADYKQRRCYLLELPGELRNRIYRLVLVTADPVLIPGLTPQNVCSSASATGPASHPPLLADLQSKQIPEPALLKSCHMIREEATNIYYGENVFKIQSGYDMFGTREDQAHFADTTRAFFLRIGRKRQVMLTRLLISDKVFEGVLHAWALCYYAVEALGKQGSKLEGIIAAQLAREGKVEIFTQSELWELEKNTVRPFEDGEAEELLAMYEAS